MTIKEIFENFKNELSTVVDGIRQKNDRHIDDIRSNLSWLRENNKKIAEIADEVGMFGADVSDMGQDMLEETYDLEDWINQVDVAIGDFRTNGTGIAVKNDTVELPEIVEEDFYDEENDIDDDEVEEEK